jgi:hypothetical protein
LWDNNPDMLYNKSVSEASYVLVGGSVLFSLFAGAVVLDEAKPKKK